MANRRIFLLLLVATVVRVPQPAGAEIDQRQVVRAIERGVAYLKREQSPRGLWADSTPYPGGVTALSTLALLNAGVPADDPLIEKALAALRRIQPKKTYTVALQTMVFCTARPKQDFPLIQRNVKWLEQTQIRDGQRSGAWSYPRAEGDNSNSQFAVLALNEAQRAGAAVNRATWRRAADYWQRVQNLDGSWGYQPGRSGTGSMTCAGVAAIVITSGKLSGSDASVTGQQIECCRPETTDASLERGLGWLGRNFSVQRNPGMSGFGATWWYYYLYGVERVGRMTARRFLGRHDWYREGAEVLVGNQDPLSGLWKGKGHAEDDPHIATSLALLFLSKGRRPVLIAKVRHGQTGDWNHHRHDLTNLTAHTERLWKRDLTWQVVDIHSATVEDLLQAPVLLISGRDAPRFSRTEKELLRAYIDRGGFLFAVASCHGDAFDRGFRALVAAIFPEHEYQLRPLPPAHPIWHAESRIDADQLHPLWGVEYGCRTSVVYCPDDLSCLWELDRVDREPAWPRGVARRIDAATALGINVLTYATGREPRYKDASFATSSRSPQADDMRRGTIAIARLQHPGGCNAAPGALANLLRAAHNELGLRIHLQDKQIAITDDQLFDYHLVFMHGRYPFQLTPAERKQLALFVQRGGTLFADAVCSSDTFSRSFRREMRRIFPHRQLAPIPVSHPLFSRKLGGYDITTVERREPVRAGEGEPLRMKIRRVEPALEGVRFGDRYGVIFSPFDISCALERHASLECAGYLQQDAARIGLNVLVYSLQP